MPNAEKAIAEAYRVMKPNGRIAVFDGDYATTTVALSAEDPLQECADAMMSNFVHDKWITRRLPTLLSGHGFKVEHMNCYGYIQTDNPTYAFTVVDRGADVLLAEGKIDAQTATEHKSEARRRADAGEFYGFINFGSVIAERP